MPYFIGVVIAFFLAFILVGKKNKIQADSFLALWLTVFGIHLLLYRILTTSPPEEYSFLLGLELPIPLLHGPFLYLYVLALTRERPIGKAFLWHFSPFLLGVLALSPFYFLPEADKILVYQNEGAGYELLMSVLYAGIVTSGITYTLLSLRTFHIHRLRIQDRFSSTEKINLSWLRYLILGSSIIWLVVIFAEDQLIYSSIVGYMLFIGYFGIKQVGIFTNQANLESEADRGVEASPSTEKPKYEKSTLTPSQTASIHQELCRLMGKEKLFTDPELSLAQLAERLDVHPNILSQVINTTEQRNFFDYVNGFRVEEFKRLALDPKNQNAKLLSLAFDCGFNSKTSFNRNFKKATGLSPSEYLDQSHIQLA